MDPKAKRLANLLKRGRLLHWQNARALAAARLGLRLPEAVMPRADLVYRTVQIVGAVRFVQARRYLAGAALDGFLGDVYDGVAGKDARRLEKLVEIYAGAFDDERRFSELVANDLAHALLGKASQAASAALSQTPGAVLKTTCLYCAEVFGDAATVRALG